MKLIYLPVAILNLFILSCSGLPNHGNDDFGMPSNGWTSFAHLDKKANLSVDLLKKSSLRRVVAKSNIDKIKIHCRIDGITYHQVLYINKSAFIDPNKKMFVINKNNTNAAYNQWNTTQYFDRIVCKSRAESIQVWTSSGGGNIRFYQAEFSRIGLFDLTPCKSGLGVASQHFP